jgi:hypothetical protein
LHFNTPTMSILFFSKIYNFQITVLSHAEFSQHLMPITDRSNPLVIIRVLRFLPLLYHGALMFCFLLCVQSSRIKVSQNLSNFVPYGSLVPRLLLHIEELVLPVYQAATTCFVVPGTGDMHIVFQGMQRLCVHKKVEHMLPCVSRKIIVEGQFPS